MKPLLFPPSALHSLFSFRAVTHLLHHHRGPDVRAREAAGPGD